MSPEDWIQLGSPSDIRAAWFYLFSTLSQASAAIFAIVIGAALIRLDRLTSDYLRSLDLIRFAFQQDARLKSYYQIVAASHHFASRWTWQSKVAASLQTYLESDDGHSLADRTATLINLRAEAHNLSRFSHDADHLRSQLPRSLLIMTSVITLSTCLIPFGAVVEKYTLCLVCCITLPLLLVVVKYVAARFEMFFGVNQDDLPFARPLVPVEQAAEPLRTK